MEYTIERTSRFKREYKLIKRRGYNTDLLKAVITLLAKGEPLPAQYKDPPLHSNWNDLRECHIQNDWLLIGQGLDELHDLRPFGQSMHKAPPSMAPV